MPLNLKMQKYRTDIFNFPVFLPSSVGLSPGDGINSIAVSPVKPFFLSQAVLESSSGFSATSLASHDSAANRPRQPKWFLE